jgi:hypothetical protein
VTEIPGWVVPGASVLVAVIGALALMIVRLIRGPVAIQDLWTENRELRKDLKSLETKVDGLIADRESQLTVNRIMGEGFDALSGYVERTTEHGMKPTYTHVEHMAIERARALRSDETAWTTLNPTQTPKE